MELRKGHDQSLLLMAIGLMLLAPGILGAAGTAPWNSG